MKPDKDFWVDKKCWREEFKNGKLVKCKEPVIGYRKSECGCGEVDMSYFHCKDHVQ